MNSILITEYQNDVTIDLNSSDDKFIPLLYLLLSGKLNSKILEKLTPDQYASLRIFENTQPLIKAGEYNGKTN